ncbi:MAG: triose-phosphate isomerase [Paracoccaceae bacterium]
MRRKMAAGNWKMNGLRAQLGELDDLGSAHPNASCDIVICPPATLVAPAVARTKDSTVSIGGQDCHTQVKGAHTGDVSAPMLADAGVTYIITGHSERRQDHHETDDDVSAKTQAVWAAGLTSILCIGESKAQREADETLDVIARQLAASVPQDASADNLVIAYEPIWAIGTGLVPTPEQIDEVHKFMRATLQDRFGDQIGNGIRLLYGGSVNAGNASTIFTIADVDGALVGGASLKSSDFSQIISALEHSNA